MKKSVIILAVLILIGGVVGVFFLTKKNGSTASSEEKKTTFTTLEACKLLSKEKAESILGTSATLGQEPSPNNSADLKVTNCVYNNTGNFQDIVSISMLVRSPITQAGADSNTKTFTNTSLVGDMAVEGYGEKATWNSSTGQLNVLKDKNWIIVSLGKAQPTSRTLDTTKKAADILLK
jgi:hypothetical protein